MSQFPAMVKVPTFLDGFGHGRKSSGPSGTEYHHVIDGHIESFTSAITKQQKRLPELG